MHGAPTAVAPAGEVGGDRGDEGALADGCAGTKRNYLVSMCNDIAAFFAIEGEAAAASVAAHLERFWAPSMRDQIIEHYG